MAPSTQYDAQDRWPDDALIAAILADDAKGFEQFVRQYQPIMTQFALTFVTEAIAEECVQDALMDAIQTITTFNKQSSLKTWLLAITANKAKMQLRKSNREISLNDHQETAIFSEDHFKANGHWLTPPLHWSEDSPEALLDFEQFQKCLDKTVNNLPDTHKSVMMLKDFIGCNTEEI
ncbi:MAG: sigma-70 family RNA polymerase sigma factor, partial [Cellvibrionales bacterium]|nr:sigma-70 family RNA polymerase sigma factor [Cellvibrionales bacterium]